MISVRRATGIARKRLLRIGAVCTASFALLFATMPVDSAGRQGAPAPGPQEPQYTPQTPDQLQQLVAPIALYPDSLVAQILAAATFPEQVVEADRWVQDHPGLKGDALAQAVDQMSWDPSVKALAAFPSVLGNMDKNLSWTSTLGDAYYNQQQDVMDAVQAMRQKAEAAGNLRSTPQQTVTTEGPTIVIQPAEPDVVYVPAYDPWEVYGPPIVAWPGWYPYPGIWYGGPYLSFGIGFGMGYFGGYGWGWHNWGCDWHNHYVMYNHDNYYSRSTTFYNRNVYYRGGRGGYSAPSRGGRPAPGYAGGRAFAGGYGGRGGVYNRPGASPRPFEGNVRAARGYGGNRGFGGNRGSFSTPRAQSGMHSSVFSGYDHGGESRSYSARGSSSWGGGGFHGGGFHGGGGGFHGGGGGFHGGGHH